MSAHHKKMSHFLISVKKHTWRAGFRLRSRRVPTHVLCYVAEGCGTVTINDKTGEISLGTAVLLTPGMRIEALATEKAPLVFYVLSYVEAALQPTNQVVEITKNALHTADFRTDSITFPISLPATLLSKLEELAATISNQDYASVLHGQLLFYELLSFVHTEQLKHAEKGTGSVEATLAYMRKNYREPLDVGILPRIAQMTPSSYCRAFKRATGMTPSEYLTHLRMKQAKELLASSQYSVKDVARSVGFSDELYFSRLFKKREGLPPYIYMKQAGQRVAVVSKLFLQDHLLAMGIQPIVAPSFPNYYTTKSGFPQHLHHRLRGTKALNAEQTIDPQEIMSLSPDVIVRMNVQGREDTDEWKQTPQTLLFNDYLHWYEYQMHIATMFHKESVAEGIIQHIDTVEKQAKDALSSVTRKGRWTILRVLGDEVRMYGVYGHALTDLFYHKLGFQPDPRVTHASYRADAFSELLALDPERIILIWSEKSHVTALEQNPLWRGLRAVQENQVYYPDSRDWDPWGPLGREYMIQKSTSFFLQAAGHG